MNNSTSNKVGLTTIELWIHLTVFYAFLCGILSTIGNTLIIIGIIRCKKLRTRFFVTVGILTFCRILLCLQFLVMAIYRMLRTVKWASDTLTRVHCHAVHFWLLVGLTVEMLLLLTLVLDRALAIVATSRYRNLTAKHAVIECVAVFLFGVIIKLPFSYADVPLQESVSCVNSYSAPSGEFNKYTQNIDLSLLITILLVYLSLMAYIKWKVRSMRSSRTSDASVVSLQRQLRLMPMLRNLVLAHCSLTLVSKILRTLAGVYEDWPEASARFTAYGGVFSTLDLFSNMIALFWSNNDIRRASLPWFKFVHAKPGAITGVNNELTHANQAQTRAWKGVKITPLNRD